MALGAGNLRAGSMRAFWDVGGSQIELGITLARSRIVIEQAGAHLVGEQHGISPLDYVYNGIVVTARLQIMEWKNEGLLVNLQGSTQSAGPTVREWKFGNVAGVLASTIAKRLTLHPTKIASLTDETEDFVLFKAAPLWQSEPIELGNDGPRVYTMAYLGLLDPALVAGEQIGRFKKDTV